MRDTQFQTLEVHPQAPGKPDYGAPCNGCGLCCAAGPCPVAGMFLFQFGGKCGALLWQEDARRYACGMVVCPDQYVRLIPQRLRGSAGRFFATRIASGAGCDFSAEVLDGGDSS